MREIKFRIWDKESNSFIDPFWHELTLNELFDTGTGCGYIFQQYTGLKDKNGVEIYEGDILKTYGECTWNETVTPAEGTVVWSDEPDEGVGFLIKTEWGLWNFDCLDTQVIGNIFEGVDK